MRRWLARMSDMRVRNTPGAPLLFRPRLRYALRIPRAPGGLVINSRETRVPHSLFLSLLTSCKLARDLRLSENRTPPRAHAVITRTAGRKKEGDDGPSPCARFYVSGIISYLAAVLSVISASFVFFRNLTSLARLSFDLFSGKRNKNAF